jgi:hypothetical protein
MQIGIGIGIPGSVVGGAAAFTPTSLSGCVLWLRADLGVTLNGSTVSAWADQSSAGNHASQGTAANQPTYSATSGPGSTSGITFDGTADYLAANGVASTFSGTDKAWTVILSAKLPSGSTRVPWASASSVAGNPIMYVEAPFGAGTDTFRPIRRDDAGAIVAPTYTVTGAADNSWRGFQFNCSGTAMTIRNNGTTTASQSLDVGLQTLDRWSLGAVLAASPSSFSNAVMAEVIVYSRALTTDESTQIYNYQVARGYAA